MSAPSTFHGWMCHGKGNHLAFLFKRNAHVNINI